MFGLLVYTLFWLVAGMFLMDIWHKRTRYYRMISVQSKDTTTAGTKYNGWALQHRVFGIWMYEKKEGKVFVYDEAGYQEMTAYMDKTFKRVHPNKAIWKT